MPGDGEFPYPTVAVPGRIRRWKRQRQANEGGKYSFSHYILRYYLNKYITFSGIIKKDSSRGLKDRFETAS